MKILKKNNVVKCEHCKSKIQYEPSEVKTEVHEYTDTPCKDRISYIECPVCKGCIILSKDYF